MKRSGIPALLNVLAWISLVAGVITAAVALPAGMVALGMGTLVGGVSTFALFQSAAVVIRELEDIREATQRTARAHEAREERAA